jgi:hypothetical protein
MQLSHNTGLVVDGATVLVAVDHDGKRKLSIRDKFIFFDARQLPNSLAIKILLTR